MSAPASTATPAAASPAARARTILGETRGVRAALAVVALHVADDNYLQPQPGTSAGDHLASGLVPIAVLALVAAVYPRLRAGARAATAMTAGALAVAVGGPSAYHVAAGHVDGSDVTGLLALPAGLALLTAGPLTLWNARRRGGSRRRRLLRRGLTAVAAVLLAALVLTLVVFPVGLAYVYTHAGRGAETPELGPAFAATTVTTSDSLELAAWYAPSSNGAAVVVYPGAARAEHARMLARHGYGVLLLEARGQGGSEGDVVRWAGDRDLLAGAAFLRARADVDPGRVGGIGFSVGGESLLEAAAQSDAFAAVVSEGAGERVGEADVSGPARLLTVPAMAVLTAAVTVFSNRGPPPPIEERIGRIAPRPVFLIYAEPGMGGESARQPRYHAAAGEPKAIWKVRGSGHTGGLEARPAEYERRVVGFFDAALLRGG